MLDVLQHIQGIFKSHQEVVHLIESVSISHNLCKEVRQKRSVPVQKSASRGLAHILLPIANLFKLAIPVVDLFQLSACVDSNVDQVETVRYHSLSQSIESSLV